MIRYMPTSPIPSRTAIAADGSTFAPGLRLLPGGARQDVERLYLVLRTLDDLADEDDPRASERVHAVECWARDRRADTARTGALLEIDLPDTPETRALSEIERRHPLARAAVLQFCEGMRHDIARETVDTDEDFTRYCQQAGGSVGILLTNVLGVAGTSAETKREAETKMATLGRAMQVTNILRDIDEDLSHDRVYIPRAIIERFGFPAPGARKALLRELIAEADALYEQGLGAIPLLRCGRRAMALSAALYREILRQIEREGFGVNPGRVVVPAWRTHRLIAKHRLLQSKASTLTRGRSR